MDKVFKIPEPMSVDGFNPSDWAKPYDDEEELYLPYEVQRWWFSQVCPNGRISVTKPELDAEHTPGAYVATACVWKDKTEEHEDIRVSARALPNESTTIDAYADCQRKAIATALRILGFWILPDEDVSLKEESKPAVKDTSKKQEEAKEEAPKKRGRKPKSAEGSDKKDEPAKDAKNGNDAEKSEQELKDDEAAKPQEQKDEAGENPANGSDKKEEPEKDAKNGKEPEKAEEPKEEHDAPKMTLEEALNVEVNYRDIEGKTIGELINSDVKRQQELVHWLATSARAMTPERKEMCIAAQIAEANVEN